MQIFIDYEKTLVLNKKTISHQTIEMLKSIAKNNEVYILSTSTLFDVIKAFDFENIHIISTLENAVYFNNTISFAKINFKTINDLLKNPSIYTAYTIVNHETLIFKYRNVSRTLSDEVLFLCQNTEKGGRCMLRDDILEKLFSNKEMQALPIGYQSVAVAVLNEVLEEIKEESPYVTISDLLSSTDVYGL